MEAARLHDALRQLYEFTDTQWAAVISMVFQKLEYTVPDALNDICQAVGSV